MMARYCNVRTVVVAALLAACYPGCNCTYQGKPKCEKADPPPFTDIGVDLVGVYCCSLAWGDYDSDGDLDLAIAGLGETQSVTHIYRNDGTGSFAQISPGLTPVFFCSIAWADYDNDGDLDLAIAGDGPSLDLFSIVYGNEGSGVFTDVGAGLTGANNCCLSWGDYDNDGDLDLALAGSLNWWTLMAKIYRNEGTVTFSDADAGLVEVSHCSLAWGDYDSDGDLDLVLSGRSVEYEPVTRLYCNDGAGGFTDTTAALRPVSFSSLAWGDYDNDGDLDLALAGEKEDNTEVTEIYRNDGPSGFTDINAGLVGVIQCSLAWGDYDNDGDLDLALAGSTDVGAITRIYRNDGLSGFTDINAGLVGVDRCSLAWGDYDNDGDLDLLVSGDDGEYLITRVYRNDGEVFNTAPVAPSGLDSVEASGDVTFSWTAASDNETPTLGLTYNLRVGTTPGGDEIMSGMANPVTGFRRIPAMGNVQHNLSWTLYGLASGTYYWSVQAVDTGFAGGAWALEETLIVL